MTTSNINIVVFGDSRFCGTSSNLGWVHLTQPTNVTLTSYCTGTFTIAGASATAAVALYSASNAQNIAIVQGGSNDLLAGTDPAVVYTDVCALWLALRNAGYKVCACTEPQNAPLDSGTYSGTRATYNASIASDTSLYDYYCDIDSLLTDDPSYPYLKSDLWNWLPYTDEMFKDFIYDLLGIVPALQAYYPCSEMEGIYIHDASGNSNTITVHPYTGDNSNLATSWNDAAGFGGDINFGGGYGVCSHSIGIPSGHNFSICWRGSGPNSGVAVGPDVGSLGMAYYQISGSGTSCTVPYACVSNSDGTVLDAQYMYTSSLEWSAGINPDDWTQQNFYSMTFNSIGAEGLQFLANGALGNKGVGTYTLAGVGGVTVIDGDQNPSPLTPDTNAEVKIGGEISDIYIFSRTLFLGEIWSLSDSNVLLSNGTANINPLSPVEGLTATTTNYGYVTLTWDLETGAASYNVYRSAVGETFSDAYPVATNVVGYTIDDCFTGDDIADGATYLYYVTAAIPENGWESDPCTAVTGTGLAVGTPTLTATGTSHGVNLSWTAVTGATRYAIFHDEYDDSTDPNIVQYDATPTTTSYAAPGTGAGGAAYYFVAAMVDTPDGSAVVGPMSDGEYGVEGQTAQPQGATATTSYLNRVVVTWDIQSYSTYSVYRATTNNWLAAATGGAGKLVTGLTTTTYTDYTAVANHIYYYFVQAVDTIDTMNASLGSAGAEGYCLGLYATSSITATTDLTSYVTVSWEAVPSAVKYIVYRYTAGTTAPTILSSTVTTTTYNDSTVPMGNDYSYTVAGVNSSGVIGATPTPVSGQLTIMSTPGSFSATTDLESAITLTWTGSGTFKIYKTATYMGSDAATYSAALSAGVVETTTETTWTDTAVVPVITYYYFITSTDPIDTNNTSEHASTTGSKTGRPATTVTATSNIGSVGLSWTAVSDATYNVYRNTTDDFATATLIASPTTNSYSDTTGTVNTEYYYYVTSLISGADESLPSTGETGTNEPLPQPTDFSADGEKDGIHLSWTAPEDLPSGSTYSLVGVETGITATSYIDTTVVPDTSTTYTLIAVNGTATSVPVTATGERTYLDMPTGLTATSGKGIVLTWDADSDAAEYNIYRGTTSGFTLGTALATTSNTTYTDKAVAYNTTYYYCITAVNGAGYSLATDDVSGEYTLDLSTLSGTTTTTSTTNGSLTIYRGDDCTIETNAPLTFVDVEGDWPDLSQSGTLIEFTLWQIVPITPTSTDINGPTIATLDAALLTINSDGDQVVLFELRHADTINLSVNNSYAWDVQCCLPPDSEWRTLQAGTLTVLNAKFADETP